MLDGLEEEDVNEEPDQAIVFMSQSSHMELEVEETWTRSYFRRFLLMLRYSSFCD